MPANAHASRNGLASSSAVEPESLAAPLGASGDKPMIWPARRSGLVERLLPHAARDLVVIDEQVSVYHAATKFTVGVEMLVVSGVAGTVVGVVTKTDVISHLTLPQMRRAARQVPVSVVMTRQFVRCAPSDQLGAVWDMMHALDLRNLPITCAELKPLGVLNARQALIEMLKEADDEDSMLRSYVMGVGYR
jgi:CBS domain-containing protein